MSQKTQKNKTNFEKIRNTRKTEGFANAKKYPHKKHPAYYKQLSRNNIEYVTFTHSPNNVKIDGQEYEVKPLNDSIKSNNTIKQNKKDKIKRNYVCLVKFVSNRNILGQDNNNYAFSDKDKKMVDNLFKTLPTLHIEFTKNKRKTKNKKK